MNEESIKRIIDLVQEGVIQVSDKLGVALPHLWEVLVRQQVLSGIVNLFFIIPIIIGWLVVYKVFKKALKIEKKRNYLSDVNGFWMATIVGTVIVGLFTFVYLASLSIFITSIINPEYHALKEILDTIKGGK